VVIALGGNYPVAIVRVTGWQLSWVAIVLDRASERTFTMGTKTDTGPPYFLGPSSKLVCFILYSNQNLLSLAAGLHFRLVCRKTNHAYFNFSRPPYLPVPGTMCSSPLPKKKTTTYLGQFRESTG